MINPRALQAPPMDDALPRGLVALGLFIYTVAGVLTGTWEVLLVPLRAGKIMVPVSVVLAVATNLVLPRLSRRLSDTTAGAVAPFIGWLVAVVVLALGRPEGDVILPGGSGGDALVGYSFMVAGFVAGLVTVLRLASTALADGRAYRRSEAAFAGSGSDDVR